MSTSGEIKFKELSKVSESELSKYFNVVMLWLYLVTTFAFVEIYQENLMA